VSVVVPFRRPASKKKANPPPERRQECCPNCGWKLPGEVRADRRRIKRELVLYFNCPECEAELLYVVTFEGAVDVE
jgi:RNase P subunit RPR2